MQEQQAQKKDVSTPDRARIKRLVDAAGEKLGGFRQLATTLEVHPQLVSNWRNGVKTPSPEAQAEMAEIAGQNVAIAGLMAMIEKTEGARKTRLQSAYRKYMEDRAAALEANPKVDPRLKMLEKALEGLDANDKTQAEAAKILRAVIDGLPADSWRKR